MKNNIILLAVVLLSAFCLSACKGNAAPTTSNAKPTAPTANTSTAKKSEPAKPTTELKNEKKPEGTAKTASKKVPVPQNWIYTYDESKGYGFYLPEGSKGGAQNVEGIDLFMATTPAPAEVAVIVLAYKDKTRTKEDLLNDAEKFLQGMGETVQVGTLHGESDDYAVAEATTTDANGKKSKLKVLVGTDVTDNYVLIVGADEDKYAANLEIIDAIWGSFEMWSGGASEN